MHPQAIPKMLDTICHYPQDSDTQWSQMLQVPTEILQQIFLLVARSSWDEQCTHSSAMIISHVCSRWRQIALSYSPLWTVITAADLCNRRWMNTVLRRSRSCPLSINFRSSRLLDEQLGICMIPFMRRMKDISIVSNYQKVSRLLSSAQWASILETLRICIEDTVACESPTMCPVGGDYMARLNEQHLPNLPFFSRAYTLYYPEAPYLRHLSLTNCCIRSASLKRSPNLEHLEISHSPFGLDRHRVSDWISTIQCLPRLTFLSIDGAMEWNPSCRRMERSTPTETTKLTDLRINRCSPGCATLLHIFSPLPRSLQFTFTDVHYNEEFTSFCGAMQAWFRSWNANTPNPYLYVSIQPQGIIVHNRSTRQNSTSLDQETSPSLQLALYWEAEYAGDKGLDLISPILNLISTTQPHPESNFYSPTSPLTRGCEELELSVGLFDGEDKAFRTVFAEFLRCFRDARKLTCVGSAAAMLAPLASQVEHHDLLPILECVSFDHIEFQDGLGKKMGDFFKRRTHSCQPLSRVELYGCRNVGQSFVTVLQRAGARVILGEGTILVDDDNWGQNENRTREPWTRDQVKLLMKKWADSSR